jgi:hypothetical protein
VSNLQLILDTSAVGAYPSVHVTEPLGEIADEHAQFGVPVAALAAAAAVAKDHGRVARLMAEPGFTPLVLHLDQWEQVAAALALVGMDVAAAQAVIAADGTDCEILTADPQLYAGLGDDPPIITVG